LQAGHVVFLPAIRMLTFSPLPQELHFTRILPASA